jgi:hypothetical protein
MEEKKYFVIFIPFYEMNIYNLRVNLSSSKRVKCVAEPRLHQ